MIRKYSQVLIDKATKLACKRLLELDKKCEKDYKFTNLGNIIQLTDLILEEMVKNSEPMIKIGEDRFIPLRHFKYGC